MHLIIKKLFLSTSESGSVEFTKDENHQGLLDYFSFRLCEASCWEGPQDDYCFEVPSQWNTNLRVQTDTQDLSHVNNVA